MTKSTHAREGSLYAKRKQFEPRKRAKNQLTQSEKLII